MGSPIRKSPDQFLFANPRSLSQLTTSFLASESLGILRSLLFSFSYFICESISLSTVLSRFAYEIAVPLSQLEKTRILKLQTLISFNFFYLVISLSIVNELSSVPSQRSPAV